MCKLMNNGVLALNGKNERMDQCLVDCCLPHIDSLESSSGYYDSMFKNRLNLRKSAFMTRTTKITGASPETYLSAPLTSAPFRTSTIPALPRREECQKRLKKKATKRRMKMKRCKKKHITWIHGL